MYELLLFSVQFNKRSLSWIRGIKKGQKNQTKITLKMGVCHCGLRNASCKENHSNTVSANENSTKMTPLIR